MDTKTKTREETKDESQSPSAEIQVRELDAVLRQEREDKLTLDTCVKKELYKFELPETKEQLKALTKRKDMLREFKRSYLDNDYVKLFDNKPLVDTLKKIIGEADYVKQNGKSGMGTYVKFAEDQSVEVITLADVATAKPGKVKKGFTYIKFKSINELDVYKEKLTQISTYTKESEPLLATLIGGAGMGIIGAFAIFTGAPIPSAPIVLGIEAILATAGALGGLGFNYIAFETSDANNAKKATKEFKFYQKKPDQGKDAIKKALYQIDGKDIDL
ncbi:hypothetical protein HON01_10280, partial [Candidatus Woesearchaeota archaeon]|nr:hypothetical protein [Candidatus Woesearchaeota archaeon]